MPKRLRAESTHPENWPKRPNYQGRNDPPPKLAETTQAEMTQAETTQGRNDPDSARSIDKRIVSLVFIKCTSDEWVGGGSSYTSSVRPRSSRKSYNLKKMLKIMLFGILDFIIICNDNLLRHDMTKRESLIDRVMSLP